VFILEIFSIALTLCHVVGTVFKLSRLPCSPLLFPHATGSFFLPSYFEKDTAFSHCSVGCFCNYPFWVWDTETFFEFSNCSPGLLPVLLGLVFLCVWLSKFWQRHASVLLSCCEFGTFLSSLVCKVNVCDGKVPIRVCVCVCVCASAGKVGI
jgi:hypothetical protein